MKRAAMRSAIAAATMMCGLGFNSAQAAEWSDTWFGMRFGNKYREPANDKDISKHIYQFQHASGYSLGTNFLNVDVLKSDSNDPANNGGGGAQEIYLVYRNTLSLGKATGAKLNLGPIRDFGISAGFDLNSKDDAFAPRVRKLVIGPSVSFNVPGFLNAAVVYRTEKNHNGLATGAGQTTNVTFDPTIGLETSWGIPIPQIGAVFKGFLTWFGEKGKDGFGNQTRPETLLEAAIMFDVGRFAAKKDVFYVGAGYQYWHNKFGSDSNRDGTGGSTAKVPQLQFEVHF